ncbi:MAG: hypothetical protein HN368_14245 [Spirochaetales bacterium]|nr:hypothetical protein [Spirochaetales bacterium]
MNHRERVLAAIRRKPVDYVPCSPFLNPQDSVQRLGKTYNFPFGPSREETIQYGVEVLDLDMHVSVTWQFFYPDPSVSSRVWMDNNVLHKTWTTPAGELHSAIRYDEHWPHGYDIPFYTDYSIGRFDDPWITSEEDLRCLEHILLPPRTVDQLAKLRFYWHEAKALAGRYGLATMLSAGSGLTGAHQVFDSERLCILVLDNPELIESYLDFEHRCTMKNYEIALDFGVDIIRRNGFYESCDFFSPQLLENLLDKKLSEEISLVHQTDSVIGYTMLTGYTPQTARLGRLGFDCIMTPDQFFKGEDPKALYRDAGSASFWTGPSDTLHMPWDDRDAVRQSVRTTFETFGKEGLILSPCSSAKSPHPWENVIAMIEEWKEQRQ